MKRKFITFIIMCIFIMMMCTVAYADDYFDIEQLDKGIIGVTYKSDSKLKVQVTFEKKSYSYNLNNDGQKEFFPLQMGNGSYKITIYQNTTGSSYKLVDSIKVELKLDDANKVYLNSIQSINWEVNPKTVKKAVALTEDTEDLTEKAKILWDYMVSNNKYDNKKLATLPTTYLPVPDITLTEKTGICYDFASLYAAMLRSKGIPAKLVKGYAPNFATGYHAWNEVYDAKNKEWIVIDTTYDLQLYNEKLSIKMKKKNEDFKKVYEY